MKHRKNWVCTVLCISLSLTSATALAAKAQRQPTDRDYFDGFVQTFPTTAAPQFVSTMKAALEKVDTTLAENLEKNETTITACMVDHMKTAIAAFTLDEQQAAVNMVKNGGKNPPPFVSSLMSNAYKDCNNP
jgi:hypothetical protein